MRTRRGRESGPKATSGYTRQLNTQQNFKTYKTNWSLFSFNQPCIFFFQPFENFYLKKKKTQNTDFFHFSMWYDAFSSLFNALKLKDASAFNCTWAWSILAFGKQAGDSTKIKIEQGRLNAGHICKHIIHLKITISVKVIQFTGEMKLSGTGLPQVSEPGLIQ